jgi:hypothetical protein
MDASASICKLFSLQPDLLWNHPLHTEEGAAENPRHLSNSQTWLITSFYFCGNQTHFIHTRGVRRSIPWPHWQSEYCRPP